MPEGVENFLLSMRTVNPSPSFTAIVPPSSSFTVEKVFAKREYSRSIAGGSLVITEVQELGLSSLNAPEANLHASVDQRDDMIGQNRLWWEAKIEVEDPVALLYAATDMVAKMDGVGFDNRGAWERREVDEQESVVPETPFW